MKINKSLIIGIITLLVIALALSSFSSYKKSNEQFTERVINLPKGYKFVTYKSMGRSLSYQLEPMDYNYVPKTIKVIVYINVSDPYMEFTFIESK